jgi:cytochrome c-type biogenesis protein CcmH/NrfG
LYGDFVWARRTLNDQKRRFPARAALQVDKRSCQAHRCLAALAFKEDRLDDVVTHLETALAINTMSAASWYTLGATALRLKLWQKARNAFVRPGARPRPVKQLATGDYSVITR